MKSLYEYLLMLLEAADKLNPRDSRNNVKALANDDDTPDNIIHKMYVAGSKELQDAWGELCGKKNYTESQGKQLLDILMKHDLIDLAAACINDEGIVSSDKLLNMTGRFKLASFLDKKLLTDYNLSMEAVLDIISCQPSNSGVAVGPGEMFLTFIIRDAKQNGGSKKEKNADVKDDSEITGDILIGNMGLEIKGSEAAFFGQKAKPQHAILKRNLNEIKSKHGIQYPTGRSEKEWRQFFNILLEIYKTPAAIGEAILKDVYDDNKQKLNYPKYIKLLEDDRFTSFDNFMMLVVAYAMKQYNTVEGFDSVMFIQSKKGVSNPTALIIKDVDKKSISDLYDVFINDFKLVSCFDYSNDRRVMPKVDLKS